MCLSGRLSVCLSVRHRWVLNPNAWTLSTPHSNSGAVDLWHQLILMKSQWAHSQMGPQIHVAYEKIAIRSIPRYKSEMIQHMDTPKMKRKSVDLGRQCISIDQLLSERIWPNHLLRGRLFRVLSGSRPREMLIWRWKLEVDVWGYLAASLATWLGCCVFWQLGPREWP